MTKLDRLFVPLSTAPFLWYEEGKKTWEIRYYGRQYTEKHVYPGRKVELRFGYSNPKKAIWGEIKQVLTARSIDDMLDTISYKEIIPVAENKTDALIRIKNILGNKKYSVIAFRVSLNKTVRKEIECRKKDSI